MKNKKKYKIFLIIIVLIILISLTTGISYAYWLNFTSQETSNEMDSSCLRLEITDNTNAINLINTSPLSDTEASRLTPYEFTVSNTCNTDAALAINLDVLNVENRLSSNYVAISLNNQEKEILGNKSTVTPSYKGNDYTAIEAYNLYYDKLLVGESKTYTLRIWLDENAESIDSMNKQFLSKISIQSETLKPLLTDYISQLYADKNKDLYSGGDGIRYIGANPNNYISFNGELWRMIGLMNNISDGQKYLKRVKLIRSESIGDFSLNTKITNDWKWGQSELMDLLNKDAYYVRSTGLCPKSTEMVACDFTETGLTKNAKKMISTVNWNTALLKIDDYHKTDISTSELKNYESYNNELWLGKVGLMYASDYGYATSGGDNSTYCYHYVDLKLNGSAIHTDPRSWYTEKYSYCKNNDWLHSGRNQLTLSAVIDSGYNVIGIRSDGGITTLSHTQVGEVYPVVYLDAELRIRTGSGTIDDPYELF